MEFTAKHRFARISPTKVRPVGDLIKGRSVNDALALLQFARRRGAYFVNKVLRSAVANAGLDVDVDALVVSRVEVNDGPKLKRGRFRARGMWAPIWKRMSHISVTVATTEADSAEVE